MLCIACSGCTGQCGNGSPFYTNFTCRTWCCLLTVFLPCASVLSSFPLSGLRSGESVAYLLSPLLSVGGHVLLLSTSISIHCLQVSFAYIPDTKVMTSTCSLALYQPSVDQVLGDSPIFHSMDTSKPVESVLLEEGDQLDRGRHEART